MESADSMAPFYICLDYGNGDRVNYTYNQQGQVTKETWEDGDTVTYRYGNSGELASITDSATGITQAYTYDLINRLVQYRETGGDHDALLTYTYNKYNQLTRATEKIDDRSCTYAIAYDDADRIKSYRKSYSRRLYTYDKFDRVAERSTVHTATDAEVLTETLTYRTPASGKTASQVKTYRTASAGDYDVTYSYTYDGNGNILSVYDGTWRTRYVYDSANQLIRENNRAAEKTWVYTYDDAGNILSKTEYAYTLEEPGEALDTIHYAYTDSDWGDLLTEYDGNTITYDAIGNPLTDGTRSYTWEHGRELASMTDGTATWDYTYNADGLRTKRTDGTTEYDYVYLNGQLVMMTVDGNVMYFNYDADGRPMSLMYNGTTYYYVCNLQGDIVGIVNKAGTQIVSYTYDAWGNLLTLTGSGADGIGKYNPLRYRGYVYDTETKLYYLQSRYYDPAVGRFINADAFASTGQGLIGNNMFAYCGNSPVQNSDPLGHRYMLCAIVRGGGISQEYSSGSKRDVTSEIAKPLNKAVDRARKLRLFSNLTNDIFGAALIYPEFYRLVNHGAPWDIKRKEPWTATIETEYPGYNVEVTFCGNTMIPEYLGNFTYGYLGHEYGIPYPILVAGSYYAAEFPTAGADLTNEINDWVYILMGYAYAKVKYLEGY